MKVRRRRALVRGQPAKFWFYDAGHIVLRHPRGMDETDVPIAHLSDPERVKEHYDRLAQKDWVAQEALAEFVQIAAGAR